MDNRCFGPRCNGLTTQAFPGAANDCKVKRVVPEDTEGCKFLAGAGRTLEKEKRPPSSRETNSGLDLQGSTTFPAKCQCQLESRAVHSGSLPN